MDMAKLLAATRGGIALPCLPCMRPALRPNPYTYRRLEALLSLRQHPTHPHLNILACKTSRSNTVTLAASAHRHRPSLATILHALPRHPSLATCAPNAPILSFVTSDAHLNLAGGNSEPPDDGEGQQPLCR